jgi:DnaJ domain
MKPRRKPKTKKYNMNDEFINDEDHVNGKAEQDEENGEEWEGFQEEEEPPTKINPYKVLELEKDATQDQVKSAYRKAALKYHPGMRFSCWSFWNQLLLPRSSHSLPSQTKSPSLKKPKPTPSSKRLPSPTPSSPTPGVAPDTTPPAEPANPSTTMTTSTGPTSTVPSSKTSSQATVSPNSRKSTKAPKRRSWMLLRPT